MIELLQTQFDRASEGEILFPEEFMKTTPQRHQDTKGCKENPGKFW